MQFKDYFPAQADEYARRRPHYPPALFKWLASLPREHDCAWDCGTGNGQAATGIAPYFTRVLATDPSADQLRNAYQHPKVEYRQATAEDSGIESGSVDIVTVAQAVHWFDLDRFFGEVRRVLKPGGTLAVWCYALCSVTPEIDAIVNHFYSNTVGPYWPRERAVVDDGYRSMRFPFQEITPPEFSIDLEWSLEDLYAYIATWSPVRRYIEANGQDPMDLIAGDLKSAWGDAARLRPVHWPIMMRVGTAA